MGRLGFVGYFLWLFILGCSSSDGAGTTAAMDSAVDGDAMSPNDGTAPAPIDGGVGGLDGDAPDVARSTRDGGATSIDQGVGADAGGAGQWRLVWSDEFEGDGIDPTHWRHEVNCWGGGNNDTC